MLNRTQAIEKYATLYSDESGRLTKARSVVRFAKDSRAGSVARKESVASRRTISSKQLIEHSPRIERTLLQQFAGQKRMPRSPSSSSINASLAKLKKLRDSTKTFESYSAKKGESYSTVEMVKTILRSNRKS